MDIIHRLQTALWLRNALFYGLMLGLLIGFNWAGFRELLLTDPLRLGVIGLFYSLVYGLCAVHNRLLYERLFRARRFVRYAVGCAALLLVWVTANALDRSGPPASMANSVLSGLILLLFGWGLYLIYQYAFLANWQLKNRLYNSRNEVAQLRAQMNPHFLFNALNNLYGVSVSEPARVPDYVLMLSELLRYQIESSQQYRVSLAEEVRFLHQLVAYERLKRGHRGRIDWTVDVSPRSACRIAPMLLYPFLENAFKYSGQLATPVVEASLVLDHSRLTFACRNTFSPRQRADLNGTQTGISNTRQRLALLYPHDRHTLTICEEDSSYWITLTLSLTNHDR